MQMISFQRISAKHAAGVDNDTYNVYGRRYFEAGSPHMEKLPFEFSFDNKTALMFRAKIRNVY